MKTITCEDPGGTFEVKVPECIGAFYIVYSPEFKMRLLVTCIDAMPDGQPKRMRVQRSLPHSGEVFQPHEYKIVEQFPLWED